MIAKINEVIQTDIRNQNEKIDILKSIGKDLEENPFEGLNHRVMIHWKIKKAIDNINKIS